MEDREMSEYINDDYDNEYDFYDWLDEQDRLYDEERANEEYIEKLNQEILSLESALTKACSILAETTNKCPYRMFNMGIPKPNMCCNKMNATKCWKKWAMMKEKEEI